MAKRQQAGIAIDLIHQSDDGVPDALGSTRSGRIATLAGLPSRMFRRRRGRHTSACPFACPKAKITALSHPSPIVPRGGSMGASPGLADGHIWERFQAPPPK